MTEFEEAKNELKSATKGYTNEVMSDLFDKVYDKIESPEDMFSNEIYIDCLIEWLDGLDDGNNDDMLAVFRAILEHYGYSVFPPKKS